MRKPSTVLALKEENPQLVNSHKYETSDSILNLIQLYWLDSVLFGHVLGLAIKNMENLEGLQFDA
ncbi:MAG TPA: hypothetical protein VH796_10485 [Nitrososphaeraceae archaeon]|jgi:hypothetical protein